ncbi:CerR family C-terminal domain-containing protein [Pseudomonas sp. 3A(2025)]
MARHKPTAEGGYQRGEETRARLIDSALKLFGERGFEGASTRDIATDAGLNAPALQYYFDNKEGLYRACVEHIIERVWERLESPLRAAEVILLVDNVTDAQLIDAYLEILGAFIAFIHDSPRASEWRLFMARVQAGLGPADTVELMNERLHGHIRTVTCAMIGRLTGAAADDPHTLIRALALNSQGMVFRVLRHQVLQAMGWERIDKVQMEMVRDVLLGQTRLTLQALVAQRDAP